MQNLEEKPTNVLHIEGVISTKPEFNHTAGDDDFYKFTVTTKRKNDVVDSLIVFVSSNSTNMDDLTVGAQVTIHGEFRSLNVLDEKGKNHVMLYMYARFIELGGSNVNAITLTGNLCKTPTYRKTPNGREISDVLLAVDRRYSRSDYIPCIAWGKWARLCKGLAKRDLVEITGRVQSRNYTKDGIEHTVYEVSVSTIAKVED